MTNPANEIIAAMAEQNTEAFVIGLDAARVVAMQCVEVGVGIDLDPEGDIYSMAVNEVLKDTRAADLTSAEFTVAGGAIIVGLQHEIEKQGAHG